MDDKGVCKDCNNRKYCEDYKPNKWQCEDYEAQHTNEEWLEQASTEEKALFLARLYGHSRKINLPELLFRNVGTREVTDVAEYIGKWLKEKHDGNS